MPRTLYHVYIKAKDRNLFYGSIKAITDQNSHAVLDVGRDTLYRWDWKKKFDNDNITIEKSELLSTNDVKIKGKLNIPTSKAVLDSMKGVNMQKALPKIKFKKTKIMKKIKATFIGADGSMGFVHGKEYELLLLIRHMDGAIMIKDTHSGVYCPYTSILTFLDNWDNIKNEPIPNMQAKLPNIKFTT